MAQPFVLANQQPTDSGGVGASGQAVTRPIPAPNPLRRASSWIDQRFQLLGQPLGQMAGDVAAFGARQFAPQHEQAWRVGAQHATEGLPRIAAEAALTSRAPGIGKALGFGDVALHSYAQTPEDATVPQQLASTALNTAAFKAAPEYGGGAGRALMQKLSPGSSLLGRVGSTLGTVGAFEGVNAANAAITGEDWNPLSAEHVAGTVASVLPWEVGGAIGEYLERRNLTRVREGSPKVTQASPVAMARDPQKPDINLEMSQEAQPQEPELSRDLIGYVGKTGKGDVYSRPLLNSLGQVDTGSAHENTAFGEQVKYKLKSKFRYDAESNIIDWEETPSDDQKTAVEQHLAKKGITTSDHRDLRKLFPQQGKASTLPLQDMLQKELKKYPTWQLNPQTGEVVDTETQQPVHDLPESLTDLIGLSKVAAVKIDRPTKELLSSLEQDQQPVTTLADVVKNSTDKLPGEKWVDFAIRTLGLKIDTTKPNDPNTLLRTTQQFLNWKFKDILGLPEDEANKLTRVGLRMMAMIGHTQGETRVIPALPWREEGQPELRSASFYVPSELPNAFMGIMSQPGLSKDLSIFETLNGLAHEAGHGQELQTRNQTYGSDRPTNPMRNAWRGIRETTKDLSHAEMVEGLEATMRGMATAAHTGALKNRYPFYTETPEGRLEYVMDLLGLHVMGAAAPQPSRVYKSVRDVLQFGGEDFRNFTRGMLKDFSTVLSVVKEYAQKVLGWKPSTMDRLESLHNNFRKLLKTSEQADKAVEAFLQIDHIKSAEPWAPIQGVSYDRLEQAWRGFNGEGYDKDLKALCQELSPMIIPQEGKRLPLQLDTRLGFIDGLKGTAQLSRSHIELADMGWLGRNYGALAASMVENIKSFFKNPETGAIDNDGIAHMLKEGTATNKAWSALTLRQNELTGVRKGQRLTRDEMEQLPAFASLSPKDKQFILEHDDHRAAAVMWEAKKQYDSYRNHVGHKIGLTWMSHDYSMKWQDAQRLGEALATVHIDNDINSQGQLVDEVLWRDKVKAQQLIDEYSRKGAKETETVRKLSEIFTTDEQGKLLEAGKTAKVQEGLLNYRNQLLGPLEQDRTGVLGFRGNPGYSPESRGGPWSLSWQPKGGELQSVGFKSEAAFKEKFASVNEAWQRGELEWVRHHNKTDTQDQFAGMDPNRFSAYNDATEKLNNRVIASLSREYPELAGEIESELRDELKPGRAMAAILESPTMKERRLIGGRETLNMAERLVHSFNNVAFTVAKRYEAGQHSLYLKDPMMRDNPQLQQTVRKYFKEITDPTEGGYSGLKKLIAFNYIFFSPSLAFVEFTQQAINHLPALLNQGMGVKEALTGMVQANKDMANAWIRGKQLGLQKNVYENQADTDVIQEAIKRGILKQGGHLQEVWQLEKDIPFVNGRNLFGGLGNMFDRTSFLGSSLHKLYMLGANAHQIAIDINQETAFLSSYRFFKSKGLAHEEAFRQADDLVAESMHGGGRSSRPLWFLGIGKANPGATVGGVMFMLQTYTYNTVAQMARYLWTAAKATAKNPTEITAAHKASAAMLTAMVVLAGVGGIPMSNQVLALIEQAFPNTEPRRKMREMFFGAGKWLNSKLHLAGQDEQMGNFIATAGVDGLANAMTPWNMANRFELGVLMGVDPYKGFQWKNVVGPGGPLLEQILLKSTQLASQGKYRDALAAAIPNSNVRRLAETALHGWELRNQDERLNVKLDASEKALLAGGFTPRRVAEFRQLNEMKKRAEEVYSLEQKNFHEEQATKLEQGDYSGVSAALMQRAYSQPNYDPREGANRVAELLQQRTIPFDPLRQGSRSSRAYQVGKLFQHGPVEGQPTEVDRLLEKVGISQSLGFPQKVGKAEIRNAALVDQLLQSNPTMSRDEALSMLFGVMHKKASAWGQMGGY